MRPLEPLKFVMVTEGRIASAAILDRVFSGLYRQGVWEYRACYEWDSSFAEIARAIVAADAVLFLRCTRPEETALLDLAKQCSATTLYCIDDDFDALDPSTPQGEFMARPEVASSRDTFLRNADLVWVFTKEMADRVRDRAQRVYIGRLPSFVEDHGWDLKSIDNYGNAEGTLTIGYGGRYIHSPDLEVIVSPLRRILDSSGRSVRAEFVDCVPAALDKHPKVTRVPYFDSVQQYYEHVRRAGWTIGLAPLIDSVGNRAKTNNKYREYAALGVPGIYSDMPVYSSSVRHKETGYLAPHTEEGMYEAISALLADVNLRSSIRRNALSDAATTYAILPMQQEWLREVSLLASARDDPVRFLVVGYDSVTTTQIDALPASRALEQQGRLQLTYAQPEEAGRDDVAASDAVFLVRAFQPDTIGLLNWAEQLGTALVCAWDDDFYSLPSDSLLGRHYASVKVRWAMRRFLRGCSLIATSTPPLTKRSRRYNANVMEAIYGFDTGRLPVEPLPVCARGHIRPIKVGFFGLQWATAPRCVGDAIRPIKQRFGERVQFEIVSSREVPEDSRDLFDWQSTQEMDWATSLQALRRRDWDIGLAPLEDTQFNAAKQATKLRDYAWAGMAMICSRVPAYQRAIIDGVHGLLVENTEEGWERAIARLIEDHDFREHLRQTARNFLVQAHTLDATMCSWHQLLWRIARHRELRDSPRRQNGQRKRASSALKRIVAAHPAFRGGAHAARPLSGPSLYAIVPETDGWDMLEVMLGLHQRAASGKLVLSVYADRAGGQPLRRVSRNLSDATDNGLFRFSFPPIVDSRQRRMLVRFDLQDPGPGTSVSLYEQGQLPRSLLGRVRGKLTRGGGALYCRLGFNSQPSVPTAGATDETQKR